MVGGRPTLGRRPSDVTGERGVERGTDVGSVPSAAVDDDVPASGQHEQVAGRDGRGMLAGARRRQRQTERRSRRLTPRFSDEELEAVSVAAALAGLTATGYVAKVAVDVATARVRPVPTSVTDAIGELLAARYQVQKFSALVNQAVTKWHSTDEVPVQLLAVVGLVGRVLPRLEEAAAAVRVSQNDAARRRVLKPRTATARQAELAVRAPDREPGGAPAEARLAAPT